MQWKNRHLSETLYTFVGIILGVFALGSSVTMFHFELGDIPPRIALIIAGISMIIRPLKHKRWAAVLSVGAGSLVFYGALKYWAPALDYLRQVWLDFFNTELFLQPWQMALLGGLVVGMAFYPMLKFLEDLLGTASNFLDHPIIAMPISVFAVLEGIVTGIPPHHSTITYLVGFLVGTPALITIGGLPLVTP
jgi:hypothetical protein